MDITDYLIRRLGPGGGRDLTAAGPSSGALRNIIGNESTTRAVIAGAYWRTALDALPQWQGRPRASYEWDGHAFVRTPADGIETYVVGHRTSSPGDHNLIIFDPEVRDDEVVDVSISDVDLISAWDHGVQPPITNPLATFGRSAIVEANQYEKFRILITPAVTLGSGTPAAMLATTYVPDPASSAANRSTGTVGVLASNALGQTVVTVAAHTVDPTSVNATVGTGQGEIIGHDPLSDSCIVKVSPAQAAAFTGKSITGPRKQPPPNYMQVEFDGHASGSVRANIISASPEIGLGIPGLQLRVLTNPVTNPGDSGAALVSADGASTGELIGFSLARTGYGSPVEYSVWIWADSVFSTHNLR